MMESYELIRSRRRTLALEIASDGRLLVRAPLRLSQARIDAFVTAHEDWIARHREIQCQRAAQRLEDTRNEHLSIVKACIKKEWKSAADAMYEHLIQSKNATFELLLSHERLGFQDNG